MFIWNRKLALQFFDRTRQAEQSGDHHFIFNGVEFSTEYAHELSRKLFKEHYLKSHQQQLINNLQARATSTTPISQ